MARLALIALVLLTACDEDRGPSNKSYFFSKGDKPSVTCKESNVGEEILVLPYNYSPVAVYWKCEDHNPLYMWEATGVYDLTQ